MSGYTFDPQRPPSDDPGWRLYDDSEGMGATWVCEATPENGVALRALTNCGPTNPRGYGWQYYSAGRKGWSKYKPSGTLADPQPAPPVPEWPKLACGADVADGQPWSFYRDSVPFGAQGTKWQFPSKQDAAVWVWPIEPATETIRVVDAVGRTHNGDVVGAVQVRLIYTDGDGVQWFDVDDTIEVQVQR